MILNYYKVFFFSKEFKYMNAIMLVRIEAAGAAIPKWNNVAPGMIVHNIKPTGTLIKNAAIILVIAAKIVLPHPKKNPFIQNTKGTKI